jgi:cytochrome c oxidase subunit 2
VIPLLATPAWTDRNDLLREMLFLPPQSSTLAPRIDFLHYLIIITTLVLGGAVAITWLYFIVRYRRRSERDAPPRWEAPRWAEASFLAVPLALFLWWFVAGFRDYVWASSPPPGSIDVYVSAKQWMWKFVHPQGPSAVNVLHVPANRPVRLLITSRDVIHSFFVPDFRIKQDAVPGRYTQIWFEATAPGRHQVLCAEFCGHGHSKMRAEVVVLEPAEFESWLQRQTHEDVQPVGDVQPLAMRELGRQVAVRKGCLNCHTVDGTRHIGPTFLDLYRRTETMASGEVVVVDEAYLTESMMEPRARIVAGFEPVMPSFHGELTPAEVGALVEFLRSLRSSHVQPLPSREPIFERIPEP